MSTSCSDCFSSDLLCGEDSSVIFSDSCADSPEYASDIDSFPPEFEVSIAGLLEEERDFSGVITSRLPHEPVDASARTESIAWILKVQRYYGFQPLTAYLAVNYFDRFLYSHRLPISGWPLQLLSVACLSLAAKLEEPLVPSLLDLQIEGAKYIFEWRAIQRMELLVLTILDWKLRSISPFCYVSFFSHKIDPSGTYSEFLTARAKEIIISTVNESSRLIEYRPSCVAAAAVLYAATDLPSLSFLTAQHAESWTDGLHKDDIMSCYQMIHQMGSTLRPMTKRAKTLPQIRVMSRVSSASSEISSASYKRRKLNNGVCGEMRERGPD